MEKWLEPKTIMLWIIIAITVVSILVFSFIRLAYLNFKQMAEAQLEESRLKLEHQKKLLENGILVQEQERTRIAADLHDSLIGKLTSLKLKHQLDYNSDEMDHLLGESIADARRISHDLSPPMLEFISLCELIDGIITPWKKNIAVDFYHDIRTDVALPNSIKIQFTRVLQELITNIYKHAGASVITVHLRQSDRLLCLLVKDDGKGFDPNQNKKGLGLQNIELRMLYLNGKHSIKPLRKGTSALLLLEDYKNLI